MRQIIASDAERGISARVEYTGRLAIRLTYAYGTKEAPPLFISRKEMLDLMRVTEVPRPPKRKGRPFPEARVTT
jgi:hypothetical protein